MFEKIVDLIENNQNFLITSHVNPDGDSLGSEIALYYYLKNLGKKVRIINYSETPENYSFLDKNGVIEKFDEKTHKALFKEFDIIIILDTNEITRLSKMSSYITNSTATKICIDHHRGGNSNGFDFYLTDSNSPATGELIYKLITFKGRNHINSDIASALYTAIMTDTGSFRYPRTDSEIHIIAANLIEIGANPARIYSEIYNKCTISNLKLLSKFLNNIKLEYNNRLIYSLLTQNDFKETGTKDIETEGFGNHLMSLESVQIGLIFTESKNGTKVSFRSKDDIPVDKLAQEFGGGGHLNAAGAYIEDKNIEAIIEEVIKKAKKYII